MLQRAREFYYAKSRLVAWTASIGAELHTLERTTDRAAKASRSRDRETEVAGRSHRRLSGR
jgi:hypothetical protein